MARPPRNFSKEFKAKEAALTERIAKAPESQRATLYEQWRLLQSNKSQPKKLDKPLLPLRSVTEHTLKQREQRAAARQGILESLSRPMAPLPPHRGRSTSMVPKPPNEAPRPPQRAADKAREEEARLAEQRRLLEEQRIKELAKVSLEEMRPEDWEEEFS